MLQFPKAFNLLQGIQLVPQSAALDSHLSVAVVVFAAHKTNYMCSNKRAGSKNKKTLGPIKTTPGHKKSKQQTTKQQTSNTICSNVRNYLSESEQEMDTGVGDGEVVVVGARSRSWGNYWGCTWEQACARRFMHCGRTLLLALPLLLLLPLPLLLLSLLQLSSKK